MINMINCDLYTKKKLNIGVLDALIIVDMQNDFMPGGNLPIEDGGLLVDDINQLSEIFRKKGSKIFITQDWHPINHKSFASQHKGKLPGDIFQSEGIGPVLWPDHCIQGSEGAKFHKNLDISHANAIIKKGINPLVDSYSGFFENDKKSKKELDLRLKSYNINRIFICGLALDYCCYYTAIDGVNLGYEVFFLIDLTKGIDNPSGSIIESLLNMINKEVKFANKSSLN